jgi:hypothetical protein
VLENAPALGTPGFWPSLAVFPDERVSGPRSGISLSGGDVASGHSTTEGRR